ncbi:M48 family metalloprotease [Flavobacteriaceae bacterium F08102]|nr:M48 family metalloprotease [Flavobacteriaceae bacterium F08102]
MRFGGRSSGFKIRLIIGVIIVLFSFFKYYANRDTNPYTGKSQSIAMTVDQEIAIGLRSVPKMIEDYGGLYPSQQAQEQVDRIGQKLVKNSIASQSPYQFDFHLLRDPESINAFALPGGQIFITYGLYSRLQNEDQLAGVLGHEIGHVVARHSAERIAKQDLTQGLISGVVMGGGEGTGQMAEMIGNVINMKYERGDELESDELGVKFMLDAGFQPEEMIGVMEILKEAAGPNRIPEMQSTHPDPENRVEKIIEAIAKYRK